MAATELDDADTQLKKKPGPNNPEEAEEFVKQINIAVDKFAETIHSYEPYKIKDAYTSIQGVLDIVDDTMCKMLRMETEYDKKDQKLCKDPMVSSDNILTGHQALNKSCCLISRNLKMARNLPSQNCPGASSMHIMWQLKQLATWHSLAIPSFILKHSECPLVQLQIPPCLCHPRELQLTKADLTPEEVYEQKAVNRVLLTAAPQLYIIHCTRNFLTNLESHSVADLFCMERKKFFTSITRCTYNTGKKLMKAEKKIKGDTNKKEETRADGSANQGRETRE